MTVDQVKAWVAKVRDMSGDDEAAHVEEDRLHEAVLEAIATNRCDNPQECARIAMLTGEIQFSRWCA